MQGFLKCLQCGIVGNRSEDLRFPLASSPEICWAHRMCCSPSTGMNPRGRNFKPQCFSGRFNKILRAFCSASAIEPGTFLLPFNVDSRVEGLGRRARDRPAGVAALCHWSGYVCYRDNPILMGDNHRTRSFWAALMMLSSSLPMGIEVKVTRLDSNESVTVEINDRKP